jgi:hypothetical protein
MFFQNGVTDAFKVSVERQQVVSTKLVLISIIKPATNKREKTVLTSLPPARLEQLYCFYQCILNKPS